MPPGAQARQALELSSGACIRLPGERRIVLREIGVPEIVIWLVHHPFRLQLTGELALVDTEGARVVLRRGRNRIGRAPDNEVIVDKRYRDVSRRHLVLDVDEGRPIAITDLSSRGTFIPRAWVARGEIAA